MKKDRRLSRNRTRGNKPDLLPGGFFRCHWEEPGNVQDWLGRWALTGYRYNGKLTAEMEVEGRSGTSTVLFGEYRVGEHYICVPDLDAGCPLSFDVQDVRWNAERLGKLMNRIDAATIAYAVADFARKTGWTRSSRPCPPEELKSRLSAYFGQGTQDN